MRQREIRMAIITALCLDDWIFETLVLKGGSALDLIYQVGERSSLDIDFSMAADLEDPDAFRMRMEGALQQHFQTLGLRAFDFEFSLRPPNPTVERWGGYRMEFKLIRIDREKALGGELFQMRRQAIPVEEHLQQRKFKIEISRNEFCPSVEHSLEVVPVRVYPPALLAAEKLRAICQQHPSYKNNRHPRPRARDFYDIHSVVTRLGVTPDWEFLRATFGAKQVPLELLLQIRSQALLQIGRAHV